MVVSSLQRMHFWAGFTRKPGPPLDMAVASASQKGQEYAKRKLN
jgi:hypothetical protein